MRNHMRGSWRRAEGQSAIEMALLLPFLVVLVLGVSEFGWLLLDQHVVTKLAREGSNLISRDATLEQAKTALQSMSSRPVDFGTRSTVIFSVLKKGATTGTANYNQVILYQQYQYGAIPATSHLTMAGGGSFGGAPDYTAANADSNTGLQVTNIADDMIQSKGGMIYVTEIFTQHDLLTPLPSFGINVPTTLYSIAYF